MWLRDHLDFRGLALVCSIAIAPGGAFSQSPPSASVGSPQNQSISPDQLDSLVAPIALYPDSLLAQVLAASTYPMQIVSARRWAEQNSSLKGKALVEAAGKQPWDPSIQALVAFPDVLQMLDQSLDWTAALGNAFLAQQSDVMAAVQRMRVKAQQTGKLQSDEHQQVQTTTVEGQPTIVIQSAPEVIYVPSYDPTVVYGAAPAYYPYPAVAYPYGGVLAASAISFGVGVAVGAIFNNGYGWGWGCNWGRNSSLYVNNNFFANNRNTFVNRGNWGNSYAGNGRAGWNHNPINRGSVPYPNRDVANRFNGGRGGMRPSQLPSNIGNIRPPSQGSASRLPGNIGNNGPAGGARSGQLPSSPSLGNRPGGRGSPSQLPANTGGNRRGGDGIGSANRASGGGQWGGWSGSGASAGNRGGAFGGGNAAQARQFSNRGSRSMSGGGFRGGGGGFRGGGGRRR